MTTKEMLKKLRDHFKRQLFEGNYDLIEVGKFSARVNTDGEIFNLWIANGKFLVGLDTMQENAMTLEFNEGEKALLWRSVEKHILPVMHETERARKLQLLTQLQKELQS